MEHIVTHHMPPVKSGKSYFLSGDKTEVCNLVTQTIAHPDQRLNHRKDRDKRMWDIDRMKPLSATVVLSYFIYSELSPFYGIIREDDKIFALWF